MYTLIAALHVTFGPSSIVMAPGNGSVGRAIFHCSRWFFSLSNSASIFASLSSGRAPTLTPPSETPASFSVTVFGSAAGASSFFVPQAAQRTQARRATERECARMTAAYSDGTGLKYKVGPHRMERLERILTS